MAEYQAGRGTTALGIVGTILGSIGTAGVLGNGNILGTGGACHENMPVNRYELEKEQKIAQLEAQIALRDANTYSDQKLLDVYKYFDGELKDIRATMCAGDKAQAVINAKFESGFGILNTQVTSISNTIANLTKTVIPNSSVCPGWGAVAVNATGCGTCCGYNANV
jgi:hypothetical protein